MYPQEFYDLEPVTEFEMHLTDISPPTIFNKVVHNSKYIAFIGNSTSPFIGSIVDLKFCNFPTDWTYTNTIALAITPPNEPAPYILTSHEDKSMAIFDIKSITIRKYFRRLDKTKILSLSPSIEPNTFYGYDEEGNIIQFVITSRLVISLNETLLLHSASAITQLEVADNFLIFTNELKISAYDIRNNLSYTILQRNLDLPVSFHIQKIRNKTLLVLTHGMDIYIYSFTEKKPPIMLFEYSLNITSPVLSCFFLTDYIFAFTLMNHTIILTNSKGETIMQLRSDDINELFINNCVFFPHNEGIMAVTPTDFKQLTFLPWNEQMFYYSKRCEWNNCYIIAMDVYQGIRPPYFRIPKSPRERCLAVKDATIAVVEHLLGSPDLNDYLDLMIGACVQIELADFILGPAFPLFQHLNKVTEYYTAIFCTCASIMEPYITFPIYENFIKYFEQIDKLEIAADMIIDAGIKPRFQADLLRLAIEKNIEKLFVHLWLECFHDYITAVKYYYKHGRILEFINKLFKSKVSINDLQKVLIWICTPIAETFPRLLALFGQDWDNAINFITFFIKILPIEMFDGTIFSVDCLIDCCMRTFAQAQYAKAAKVLDMFCPMLLTLKKIYIPPPILPFLTRWIFTSQVFIATRESLLMFALKQFPELFDIQVLLPYCILNGFSNIAIKELLPIGDYDSIIRTMAADPQKRSTAFQFIQQELSKSDEISEKIYKAVENNIDLLILISPADALELIATQFQDLHVFIMAADIKPYAKWIYLRHLIESEYCETLLREEDHRELFELACQFESERALPLLESGMTSLKFDEALPICTRYHVLDACIHIHTILGNYPAAVTLMADEIEYELTTIIKKHKSVYVPSIDTVKEAPELTTAYNDVQLSFELLQSAPDVGDMHDKLWRSLLLGFQLPLWLTKDLSDPGTAKSLTIFFAYFVTEALNRSTPQHILLILRKDFASMDQYYYRLVLQLVFKHLSYQEMLNNTVHQLLLEDCLHMYKQAVLVRSRGAFIMTNLCQMCQTPVNGYGGIGCLTFQCGHCFHDNTTCGGHTECPLCHGTMAASRSKAPKTISQRTYSMKLRSLQRVDYGLRRHYGIGQDTTNTGTNLYIFSEYPVEVKKKLVVTLPEEPEQMFCYLEL